MRSERMPRPLPMKRKTTAMFGAKKLRLTFPPWPTVCVVTATAGAVGDLAGVEHAGNAGGHRLGVLLAELRRSPRDHVEARRLRRARVHDGDQQAVEM
jgi:hypothetical protein